MAKGRKRKRGGGGANARMFGYGKHARVVPGVTRTGGYYGRFGIGGELKFLDTTCDDALVSTSGTLNGDITPLNGLILIPQGDGESARIGRKVNITKIGIRMTLVLPNTTTLALMDDTVRVILIQDKQCNGALPAVTDVLQNASFDSFNNLANSQRFHTLWDKTVSLSTMGLGVTTAPAQSSAPVNKSISKYIKCNIPIEYSGTTGNVTTIRSNNIFFLYISRSGAMKVECEMRFRYSDN